VTKAECQQLIDSYVEWLRKELNVVKLEHGCELTTPFLDRHNDHLQVYAQRSNGLITLSDDGYILADLKHSGLELTTEKRKLVFESVLNGFGVRVDKERLVIEASPKNLGQRLHSFVQAMLAINDMFLMAQARVTTFFWEDVKAFLDQHEVRYSPRVKIAGRSGYDHGIDFLIPKSRVRPERFVQVINAPSKNTITSFLFALSDTRPTRPEPPEAYTFLNDRDRDVGGDVIEALNAYDVAPIVWSARQRYISALAE
jgi:Domain of unknown function DUF1829/Domain of unknown function DUF1828